MSEPTNAGAPAAPKLPAFFRTIKPDEQAPVINRDDLRDGTIARYINTKTVEVTGRKSHLHVFYARGGEGVPFGLWGSAELDSQLRKLRGGTGIVFIRYNGKQPHPSAPDRTVHKWTVQEAVGAKLEHVRKAREPFAEQESALDAVIAAAAERERARLAESGPGLEQIPPPDDDDLPF